MDEESIHDNLSKRLKQSFDCFYRDQERDPEKFNCQGLAPDFFSHATKPDFFPGGCPPEDELAIPCQARNP